MALSFPGTIGLRYNLPTPQIRLDATTEDTYPVGVAAGKWAVSFWIRPRDIATTQELVAVMDDLFPGFYACFFIIRLEGGFASGTLTCIMQGGLFGFCIVRRTDASALVADVWQHVLVICDTNGGDMHIYIDGVQATYAFSRTETLLAPYGGSDVLLGSTIRGLSGGPVYAAGVRIIDGDPGNGDPAKQFTTTPGDFYDGDMQAVGIWHGGVMLASPAEFVEMLAAGYSPLFLSHRLEGSTATHGLVMSMPLVGEVATEEADPLYGGVPHPTETSGELTWTDGPGICEPCDPDEPAPGVPLPTLPKLCLPFGMPRAEIYSNPGNPADILPIVYGDFRVSGIRGPIPAILIDQGVDNLGPWVYCAAFHPSLSLEDVYIGDVVQTGGYTFNLSDNFQNRGTITTITFPIQPPDIVSWRGQGLFTADGTLLENCIEQLVHLLTTFGNFARDEDFDPTALAESVALVEALGYKTAFVVRNEQVTQDWLTEMLFNVMGYWRVNGLEQVELHIDPGATIPRSNIAAHIIAARDCPDGNDDPIFTLDRQWLVNDVTANYLWNYSAGLASGRLAGTSDPLSVNAYGVMAKEVTLIGLRRPEDVLLWSLILLIRQSARTRVEGGQLRMKVKAARVAHVSTGDYIGVSWADGPTREGGRPYVNEVLRVTDVVLDAETGGIVTLSAVDLGVYLTGPDGLRELEPVAA
jgi:hypothetical protein